jgi:hypothetical protein
MSSDPSTVWHADPIAAIDEIQFRRPTASDWANLVQGFAEAFDAPRDIAEWSWKFGENFERVAALIAITPPNTLVAYYGSLIRPIQIDGQDFTSGQPVDVFRLRRAGTNDKMAFTALGHEYGRRVFAEGWFDIGFGFPGAHHADVGKARLGYENSARVTYLARKRSWSLRSEFLDYDVSSEFSPGTIDELWRTSRSRYPVALVRDAEFFTNRYQAHPTRNYHHKTVLANGIPHATAVLHHDGPNLYVVDLLWDGADSNALRALDVAIAAHAARSNASTIGAWLNGDDLAHDVLSSCGWYEADNPIPVGIYAVSFNNAVDPTDITDRMYVTFGDSDLV